MSMTFFSLIFFLWTRSLHPTILSNDDDEADEVERTEPDYIRHFPGITRELWWFPVTFLPYLERDSEQIPTILELLKGRRICECKRYVFHKKMTGA